MRDLESTIALLMAPGKGILAADESHGTISRRFEALGIQPSEENRRRYRQMLFTTPDVQEYISGVILFDETLRQVADNGKRFVEILVDGGIVPGIKVDRGAKPLAAAPGERVTEGLDGLRERLEEYRTLGARFAKWRAVITIGDGIPSTYCLDTNARALARYAALCQEAGLVPIVEPEVLMDGAHSLERGFEVTEETLDRVFIALRTHRVILEQILLKPNMVLPGASSTRQANIREVADATVRCLRRAVPAAVPGVVFLSGGQDPLAATAHLSAMNAMPVTHPWPLSFSFARALQSPAMEAWRGELSNVPAGQRAFSHRARCNAAARKGLYTPDLEVGRRMTAGAVHPLAGKPAPDSLLVNVPKLVTAYYAERPDPSEAAQRVAFGTSGHRGSSLQVGFNETHVLAITQAICLYRRAHGIEGPLFLGWDTHALSEPARVSALEVLAANGVETMVDVQDDVTPTPVISHAILAHNRGRTQGRADGIVISPSHNPPEYGGIKYDPPTGGPADTPVTDWIQDKANGLLEDGVRDVARIPWERAREAATVHRFDYLNSYVGDLRHVIDMDVLQGSRLNVGIDPLGGASLRYWDAVGQRYGLQLSIVNRAVDPRFRFMTVDRDGAIRMDPSSPYAMAGLIELRERYDLAFANDPDADRFGIVTRGGGLLDPNHYLAAAVWYLLHHRPDWKSTASVGKTIVTSSLVDRVAARLGRRLVEVPVGFKYFVDSLLDGSLAVAGEESAGASFLRRDGAVWTTDKDGLIMGLLAVEMMARTGRDPAEQYSALVSMLGESFYARADFPATPEQKAALAQMRPGDIRGTALAGDTIRAVLTTAPGDHRPIGGVKVVTDHGWFAARPSGTEAVFKLYAESFKDRTHLHRVQEEAHVIIQQAFTTEAAR